MKIRLKSKFVVIVTMFCLLLQALAPVAAVFAAGNTHNNVITSIKLTKSDLKTPIKTIGESQQMQLVVDFSLPNNTVKEGDTTVIQVPNELAIYKSETFPIKNAGGELIANAVVDPASKTITVTYTKYVEQHSDVSGSLHVTVLVDQQVVKQPKTLHLTIAMGHSASFNLDFDYTGIIGDNPDESLSKWSFFDKDDPTIVHCRIRVNAKGGSFPYIKVTDTLESKAVSYIKDSVRVKKGKWKLPSGGGYFSLENETDVTGQFPLTYSENSFTVQFNNLQGEGYLIIYDVKLGYTPVNQEEIKNRIIGETANQQLINTLTIALYQQSGGEANGYNYTIKIHKENEEGVNLSGAKFEVIRNSTQAKIGEITTGEDGNGSLSGLLKDNYTLREIEAPKGYVLDKTEIPVTPADFGADKAVLKTVKNKPAMLAVSVNKKWIGKELDSVTVHLYADDKDTGESAVLNKGNGWKHEFKNLRQYTADGAEIKYTVKEDIANHYENKITGSQTDGYTITNINKEKINIPFKKVWIGREAQEAIFKLENDKGQTVIQKTITAADQWKGEFKDLPRYDETDGHEIKYTISEVKIDGYNSVISGTQESGFTVTNTITGKVSIPVTKTWVGKEGTSAEIHLFADDQEIASATLNASNNWQYTFTNLEKYKDGKEIKYTIKEDKIENYKSEITGDVANGFMVKNTNIEKISIPVTKQWIGKEADKIEIKLLADGKEKSIAILSANTGWKHEFKDLPKYDETDGHEIVYTIAETKVDGYNTGITGTAKDGFTITNTITGKVSVPVTKTWVGKEGTSAEIHLFADDQEIASATLNAGNNWQYTFTNLEKYKDGKEIKYTIKEDKIENYKSEITGDVANGFMVKNTNIEKISVPVLKQWVGKPDDKVEVKLLADNVEKEAAILTADTGWKHEFINLLRYDENDGHEIIYTVSEVKIDGYTTGISGTPQDGFTITNTITGKVSVPVTKKWIGMSTDSIIVNLFADGKKIDSQKLSKGNHWQYTFKNLEQYKNGKEIKYTVEEEKIFGYSATISGNAKDGYIITNVKNTPPSKQKPPKTGDTSNRGFFAGLLVLSGSLLTIAGLKRRKENQAEK